MSRNSEANPEELFHPYYIHSSNHILESEFNNRLKHSCQQYGTMVNAAEHKAGVSRLREFNTRSRAIICQDCRQKY